ncbi:MAG: DNA-3-methyladenine glycosylase I [Vagococcus sp.]
MTDKTKCSWAYRSPSELLYHDTEWGIPVHDDLKLFELLVLETMQAGLSWTTIINKRHSMADAFDHFNPHIIQTYDANKIEELLLNPGIIRHRLKLEAMVQNATCFLAIQHEFGSFDHFIWKYVSHKPIQNHVLDLSTVPSQTELSTRITKDLKKRGFKFLGPTTTYAFMQSIGMVNDHIITCPSYKQALDI